MIVCLQYPSPTVPCCSSNRRPSSVIHCCCCQTCASTYSEREWWTTSRYRSIQCPIPSNRLLLPFPCTSTASLIDSIPSIVHHLLIPSTVPCFAGYCTPSTVSHPTIPHPTVPQPLLPPPIPCFDLCCFLLCSPSFCPSFSSCQPPFHCRCRSSGCDCCCQGCKGYGRGTVGVR